MPLVTDTKGEKFGKSAGNAVWLDATRTTPYELYQFFLNTADAEALSLLRLLTFVGADRLVEVEREHLESPHKRIAQSLLAAEVVDLVHGGTFFLFFSCFFGGI